MPNLGTRGSTARHRHERVRLAGVHTQGGRLSAAALTELAGTSC
jgi:hypothetical protein